MKPQATSRYLTALACSLSLSVAGSAQEPPTPGGGAGVPAFDLPDEQLEAGLVEPHPLALPSPPELLYILSKEGSPKWRKLYLPSAQAQESDRSKTALWLGVSIAEAHIATMARDAQKIRDVTNDLQRHARVLGIGDGLTENSRSINSSADAKAWGSVAFQLESLVAHTSATLRAQRDADLATLITTGLWVRLLQISTSVVTEKDFADTSVAISSHWTLMCLISPLTNSKAPAVVSTREQLAKISRMWAPEKLASGHQFDDALIKETHNRLSSIINGLTP